MLNDVKFNDLYSAYDDWSIVLTEKEIPFPEPKISQVDVPGMDGVLDLSEVLTGDVQYNNRTIKLTFEMLKVDEYNEKLNTISNYLHGKMITFSFTDFPDCFYKGRATISEWECSKNKGKIVISIDADPFRYNADKTIVTVKANGSKKNVLLTNQRKRVCPEITVSGDVSLSFNGETYKLVEGTYQFTEFTLEPGSNNIAVSGTGEIKISYREGLL